MAGSVPTLYWFDRWDERIGLLRVVGELGHTEELNGEDTLEFCSYEVPTKGDRLLWLDGGTWREHVVVRTDEPVAGLCSVYAESSLCELLDDFIEEAQLALAEVSQPKVSYEVDVAVLDGDDADLGDTVAVIDTSRDDVVGIDGNLTTAASVTVVENTVTTAIDDLDF